MNQVDPRTVIAKSAQMVPDATDDPADYATGPVAIDATMLEASLRVRATAFYQNVGPRRRSKPRPAREVLRSPHVPKARRTWRLAALTAAVMIAASGASAWAILSVTR